MRRSEPTQPGWRPPQRCERCGEAYDVRTTNLPICETCVAAHVDAYQTQLAQKIAEHLHALQQADKRQENER